MASKRKAWRAIRMGVSLALLAVLYLRIRPETLLQTLRGAAVAWLPVLFTLLFFNTFISALKWKLLLGADRVRVGLWTLVASYLVGSFFNLFLPSSIGGDAYRVVDVARRGGGAAGSFASVFADRLTGFLAVAIWGLAFAAIGFRLLPDPGVLLIPAVVFIGLLFAAWLPAQPGLVRKILAVLGLHRRPRVNAFAEGFLSSIAAYRRRPAVLAAAMGLSLVFKGVTVAVIAILARMLELPVSPLYLSVIVPLVTLLEALPISVFGLGVRDVSYVFFLGAIGVPQEQALALSLVYVAVTIVYVAAGGVLFMLRPAPEAQKPPREAGE